MKSATLIAPMQFEVRSIADPVLPADGLILQVKACGVCGSDLRRWKEGPLAGAEDLIAGHEIAGIVAEGDIMSNLGTVGNFGVVHKSRAFNFSEVGLSMINLAFTVDLADTYITIPSTTTGGQSIRYLSRRLLVLRSRSRARPWHERL